MRQRIFVQKKDKYSQGKHIKKELNELLGLQLDRVDIIARYDVFGDVDIDIVKQFLSEPPLDNVAIDKLSIDDSAQVLVVENIQGGYDQRADAAEQGIALLAESVKVESAVVYVFFGLKENQLPKVEQYLVNPIEKQVGSMEYSLKQNVRSVGETRTIEGFCKWSKALLQTWLIDNRLAMSVEDALTVQEYFADKRDPTNIELRVLDTYWSDHCRHTSFLTHIHNIEIEESRYSHLIKQALQRHNDKVCELYTQVEPLSFMQIATIDAKYQKHKGNLSDLDISDEINACSIVVPINVGQRTEDYIIQFKNETHNHPTEIEPFGGASTCLGGAIRDPLAGRAYVYQAMRVTGSGDPRQPIEHTRSNKLPQRTITTVAAQGFASYGNQVGLATGEVQEYYHQGYVAKRMEIGAVVGFVKKSSVHRQRPQVGDVVMIVGGRTGRDGCGGATGSSVVVECSLKNGAEVQKGNPVEGRKLQRLFGRRDFTILVKRCNDFGAGGVSVAIGELADSVEVHLDKIATKYEGMSALELAISESQERMAIVIDKKDVQSVRQICKYENVECTEVGTVLDDGHFTCKYNGAVVLRLNRQFLNSAGAKRVTSATVQLPNNPLSSAPRTYQQVLSDISVANRQRLSEMFDSTVGGMNVLMPFGGLYQLTPVQGMVSIIPAQENHTVSTIMTHGFDPHIAQWSPYHGGHFAVVIALAKAVAMGASYRTIRLSLQEYFPKLDDKNAWGRPLAALLGASYVMDKLDLAAIGGKDSMSGSYQELHVPPTLVAFGLGILDASTVVSPEFKRVGSMVYLLQIQRQDDCLNIQALAQAYDRLHSFVKLGKIASCSAVGVGGTMESVFKACIGNMIGFRFLQAPDSSQGYGNIVVECDDIEWANIEGASWLHLGNTIDCKAIRYNEHEWTLKELWECYDKPLQSVFGSDSLVDSSSFVQRSSCLCDEPLVGYQNVSTLESGGQANSAVAYGGQGQRVRPAESGGQANSAVVYDVQRKRSHNSSADIAKSSKCNANTAEPDYEHGQRVLATVGDGVNVKVVIPVFPGSNGEHDMQRAWKQVEANVQQVVIRNKTDIKQSIKDLVTAIDDCDILALPGGFSFGDEPDGSAKSIVAVLKHSDVSLAVDNLIARKGLILGICNGFQALIKSGLIEYERVVDTVKDDLTLAHNRIGRHVSRYVRTQSMSKPNPWNKYYHKGSVVSVPISHGEGRLVGSIDKLTRLLDDGRVFAQYVCIDNDIATSYPDNPNGSAMAIEGLLSHSGQILGKMGHSERISSKNIAMNIPLYKDSGIFRSAVEWVSQAKCL